MESGQTVYINSEELIAIAKSIETKKEQIINIYKSEVLPALETSENCLRVAGLNYSEIITAFDKVYNTMGAQISTMTDAIITRIAPNYDAMTMTIRDIFNSEFASEMQAIINDMNSKMSTVKPL